MTNNRQSRKNISGLNGGFSFLPQITDRTSDQFLQDIVKIQESQYTPINHVPTLFGRRIDLLAMYNAVAQRGGLKKMITEMSWEGVMKDLKIPPKCANACVALRNIYQRYLEQFERLQRNKATISDIEEELQIESENRYKNVTQKSTLTHFNINPNNMVYRTDMHQINSHKRQESGLSCDLSDVFEYRNLEMSLKSGLVNEIEFSLNTCLLMSYQNEGVQLWRNPKILDLILTSIGISERELYSVQPCCDSSVNRFLRFWNNTIVDELARKFLDPDVFTKDKIKVASLDTLCQIFTINEELTIYDKEGQRIQLVATIIRNLAFDNSNGCILTQNLQCFRFILLCCYASHFALRQLGLEILSMLRFPVCGILFETLSHLLVDLIKSEDRVDRLRGLELISRLCDQAVCTENIEFFASLPKSFFTTLISTLIVHDLHLLVLALEAVYGLSEIDQALCCKLIECSTETLATVYTLLSLEAQVMGTQSLIRIRVMQGPSVIAGTSNNYTNNNNSTSSITHQNQKQSATSLMPPPPVPIHKVPIAAMPVSHAANVKPLNYATTDLTNLSKSVLNQKISPLITKHNTIITSQSSSSVFTISPTTKSSTMTTGSLNDSIPSISSAKPFLPSHINLNVQYPLISQKVVSSGTTLNCVPITNTTLAKSTVPNYSTIIKSTCISTPLPTMMLDSIPTTEITDRSSNNHVTLTSSTPNLQTPSHINTISVTTTIPTTNNFIENNDLQPKESEIVPFFANKQEFVKSWLLGNYVEFSQCTVPLFLIYKQLQIAVQNHFKDSEMVSAEEFHRLVRLLFPQVQLVQLYTPGGAVEIHYYNLKSSPKTTTLESLLETSKTKPVLSNSNDSNNCNTKSNVPHINNAQSNCVPESKSLKRHSNEILNGFTTDQTDSNHFPKKKPKLNSNDSNSSITTYCQKSSVTLINDLKENHNSFVMNGVLGLNTIHNDYHNHIELDNQVTVKSEPLYSSVTNYSNTNGSAIEEIKHSDSEMKAFSSSTVSPIHCESLANGTDGSSEGTLDSDLGKIVANISSVSTQATSSTEAAVPIIANNVPTDPVVTNTSSDDASTSDSSQQRRTYKRITSSQLGRTRSRFRNNGSGGKGKQRNYSNQRPHNLSYLYICEWDNCLQSFDKPQKVYGHVYTNHFMTLRTEVESICLWAGCEDKTQRTPLPLLNHVNEQHCNNVALESARQQRLANERDRTSVLTAEVTSSSNTETEPSPKFVNINTNNYQPKMSLSSENPSSSVAYQIVTQPSIPNLSTIQSPKPSPISNLQSNIISSIKKEKTISIVDSTVTQSQTVPTIVTAAAPTIIQPHVSSVRESPVSSTNSTKVTQILDVRSNTQTLSKVRPPSSPSTQSYSTPNTNLIQNDVSYAAESSQSIKQPVKEGPVTKHIRFLSALILRNLCQNSSIARKFVSARHQQIFEMSISGCESSTALSECLLFSSSDNSVDWESAKIILNKFSNDL